MNKKLVASLAVVAAMSVGSTTQAREFGDIYMECGLGAMIFPTNNVMAAISNVTWDLGTTAVSSDASSEENCKGKRVMAAAFIEQSYAQIEADLAAGEGEHLTAMMTIIGCDSGSHAQLTDVLRSGFGEAVTQPGYSEKSQYEKSESLYNLLNEQANGNFAGACSV